MGEALACSWVRARSSPSGSRRTSRGGPSGGARAGDDVVDEADVEDEDEDMVAEWEGMALEAAAAAAGARTRDGSHASASGSGGEASAGDARGLPPADSSDTVDVGTGDLSPPGSDSAKDRQAEAGRAGEETVVDTGDDGGVEESKSSEPGNGATPESVMESGGSGLSGAKESASIVSDASGVPRGKDTGDGAKPSAGSADGGAASAFMEAAEGVMRLNTH